MLFTHRQIKTKTETNWKMAPNPLMRKKKLIWSKKKKMPSNWTYLDNFVISQFVTIRANIS